jgi:hypothetical protein
MSEQPSDIIFQLLKTLTGQPLNSRYKCPDSTQKPTPLSVSHGIIQGSYVVERSWFVFVQSWGRLSEHSDLENDEFRRYPHFRQREEKAW